MELGIRGNDYIGEVIYTDDITHSGRCKVKVIGLFDGLPDENIPWFSPSSSNLFSSNGGGSLSVPKKGSYVKVRFANDDFYSGEYSSIQFIDPDLVEEIKDDYEGTQVLAYDSDAELLVLYQNMSGLKIYCRGGSIIIDPSGNIQLKHSNSRNVIELNNNDIIITTASSSDGGTSTTGKVKISSGSQVEVSAPNVMINSKNIQMGDGQKHFVIAEELIPILQNIVTTIAAKTPQGAPGLVGNMFENIKSRNTTTAG